MHILNCVILVISLIINQCLGDKGTENDKPKDFYEHASLWNFTKGKYYLSICKSTIPDITTVFLPTEQQDIDGIESNSDLANSVLSSFTSDQFSRMELHEGDTLQPLPYIGYKSLYRIVVNDYGINAQQMNASTSNQPILPANKTKEGKTKKLTPSKMLKRSGHLKGRDQICGNNGELNHNRCDCYRGYVLDVNDPFNCIKFSDCPRMEIGINITDSGYYTLFTRQNLLEFDGYFATSSNHTERLSYAACQVGCDKGAAPVNAQRWLLSLSATGITCLSSLFGMPMVMINHDLVVKFGSMMSSLSAGALIGAVVFHIYPEATESLEHVSPWKQGFCFIIGILMGIIIEQGTKYITERTLNRPSNNTQQKCVDGDHRGSYRHSLKDILIPPLPPSPSNLKLRDKLKTIQPVGWTVLIGDFFNNFTDGILIASAFSGCSSSAGWLVTLIVCAHEIPHEIGDFFVLIRAGMTIPQAAFFNIAASSSAVFGVILMLSCGEISASTLGYILATGSGIFLFIAMAQILPDVISEVNIKAVCMNVTVMLIGAGLPLLFQDSEGSCDTS